MHDGPTARVAKLARGLLATALLATLVGCAAPVRVAFDPDEDFSRYRTWAWRPNATASLDAPSGRRSPLNDLLAQAIARELNARGYRATEGSADLLVGYGLTLDRRVVTVQVPRAPYLLSSMSFSPSYWVEGSNLEKQEVSDVTIAIEIENARGHEVWRGRSEHRLQRAQKLDLDGSIVTLLESLPARPALDRAP